jgi:hypothetical protein
MSGGSWDYIYSQIDEVADRLLRPGQSLERRAMGAHVRRLAAAMRAVEWVDSGDMSDDTPQIRAFLAGFGEPDKQTAQVIADDLRTLIATAGETLTQLQSVKP